MIKNDKKKTNLFSDIQCVAGKDCHNAIGPDSTTSCLLDWTDTEQYVAGSSRDKRLSSLWESYYQWCEGEKIGDRAMKRLFTVQTLKPDGSKFCEVSQKILNATACRHMLFWLCSLAKYYALTHMQLKPISLECFSLNHFEPKCTIPVVPHKAVAEVSRIGNYRRDWLL